MACCGSRVADMKTLTSWKRSRSSSALSSPRSFGISTESATSSGTSIASSTSRASASCGITSARTKLVTSSRRSPVRASSSISRTLSAVAMTSGSFWKPSRGPTSRMRTCWTEVLTSAQSRVRPLMTDSVTVIGASGALGYGLALRLGIAGVPIVIGSRDAGRAEETAAQARRRGAGRQLRGLRERRGRGAPRGRVPVRAVPQPVRDADEPQGAPARGPAAWSTRPCRWPPRCPGKATRMLGVWQGSAAQQAAEMVPDGVRVVSALHTVSAAGAARPGADARRGRARLRRQEGRQARARPSSIERIPGLRCVDCGRLEQARITESLTALLIGDQRPLQDPRGHPHHRRCRTRCGSPRRSPRRRHRRREARARDARRGRRRPRRDRQHRRRRRDPRRPRLARPGPRDVLARRPHRRARLGPARRHLRA